ncbi:MAG: hypothetical protein IJK26_10715 [Clostridia bacterium]|nr:hypothetical protein [Clostridia bacterium]
MALNYEKYSAEHDAILDYYKPIIRKNNLIAILFAVLAFICIPIMFAGGKAFIIALIGMGACSSLVGKFASKRNAARRAMNQELNQLELARKQASISD